MQVQPPKYALRFLCWFCREDYLEEIEGNLIELFEKEREKSGSRAGRQFFLQVLLHFRPAYIRSFENKNQLIPYGMYKNYLTVAWRNMLKHKLYSAINLSGLTVGLTCFILIALYIQFELSYDSHHEKADQAYRVIQKQEGNTFRGTDFFAVTPEPLAPALLEAFPEVQAAATINDPRYALETVALGYEDKIFSPRILYADKNVFEIFTIPMVEGMGGPALEDPNSILLSRSLTEKYFGNESPLGKNMLFNNERPLTVRGVFEDLPKNQHLMFEFIIPIKNYAFYKDDIGRWGSNNYRTYLVLPEGYDHHALEMKMSVFDEQLEAAYAGAPFQTEYFLQPVKDIYLHSHANFESAATSDIRYVYLFLSIAFIILLLATINYMNLATARSMTRSKEVGMRKVLGARKKQLVTQLLGESFLFTFASFALALALAYFLLPSFNSLLDKSINFNILGTPWFLISMLLLAVLIGGLSGLYPALFLSALTPVKAIKGGVMTERGKGHLLRNTLIIGQFTTGIVLAVSSMVVYQQLQHIQQKKLGYNRDQVAYIPYYFEEIGNNYQVIRNELLNHPQITKVALSSSLPIDTDNQGPVNQWEGNDNEEIIYCYRHFVDDHFLDLYEMEMLEGRNFSPDYPTDSSNSYILNESAVAAIGWTPTSAIGKGFRNGQVIGVVKDFHFQPMDLKIEPMFMMLRTAQNSFANYGNISIKLEMDELDHTLAHIQQTFKNITPGLPYELHYLDESFNQLYESEQRLGQAFNIFTALALFIACVGLFGLVSHSIVQRAKEIGIRKVLGASASHIVRLLSKDFLRLVTGAVIIAIPVSWYVMQQWLQNYAYRIDLEWWIFVFAGMGAVMIAFLTISTQTLKAANTNPVECLRDE